MHLSTPYLLTQLTRALACAILCGFPGLSYAQSGDPISISDSLFRAGEYEQVIPLLEAHLQKHPTDLASHIKIGKCRQELGNHQAAIPHLRLAAEAADPSTIAFKLLGQSLIHTGEYEEARYWFNKYETNEKSDDQIRNWRPVIDTLDYLLGNQMGYEISILTVNTPQDELSMALLGGNFLYCSNGSTDPDYVAPQPRFRMLLSEGSIKGRKAVFFKPTVFADNDASSQRMWACTSPDEKEMAFIQYPLSAFDPMDSTDRRGALMIASLNNGALGSPIPLLPGVSAATPSFSPDGRLLFFAAQLPDSHGGFDLYYMRRDGAGWSKPYHLSSAINTPGNDWYPLLTASGQFYFSTDGFSNGQGAFDIFCSLTDERLIFGEPMSLPYPINTEFNDYSFYPLSDGNTGFLSSDRPDGIGGVDIYYFRRGEMAFPCKEPVAVNTCGYLFDETRLSTDGTGFIYEWDPGDGTHLTGDTVLHCFRRPGLHRVRMNVLEPGTRALNSFSTRIVEIDGETQAVILAPAEAALNQEVPFDGEPSYLDGYDIVSWKWDMGDGHWHSGEKVSHTYRRPGLYVVKLTVAGINSEMRNVGRACMEKTILIK